MIALVYLKSESINQNQTHSIDQLIQLNELMNEWKERKLMTKYVLVNCGVKYKLALRELK